MYRKGLIRLGLLLVGSIFLFLAVGNILKTNDGSVSYFLSLISTHLILSKNEWIIDFIELLYENSNREQ
ncbi:short-chain dehydrogenase [Alkalihalobacillus sp. AL-G]|uniref:short-chain dehydrogenase n=1 Tax=Alkalihalobacillus sp. AL-G TaxID=2926399 RepID=UPI00272BFE82|nr:short-chain dehydrogenase [Alkalihalobacillus sp. AL-G]WLD94745.1 short-chain dehydrogenase [Alkalihalobacillus sp. AL-G]